MPLRDPFSHGLRPVFSGILGVLLLAPSSGRAQTIWVEGERPTKSTIDPAPSWYGQVKTDMLSGGRWISHYSDDRDGLVEYVIQAPATVRYAFWVRANPTRARLSYAIGPGRWRSIDMTRDVVDIVNVAADGKADLRSLGWKKLGEFTLARGRHTIRFLMSSEDHHHGAIDAFVLTTRAFRPIGTLRPEEDAPVAGNRTGVGDPGTWSFLPRRDAFRKEAAFDLRGLNEKVAGQGGFVRLGADGESFVRGDGSPVRFWAVNTDVAKHKGPQVLAQHARFLAKRGVNMVRLHGYAHPKGEDSELTRPDPKFLDQAWRLVAAMKKEGIYTTISPYWATIVKSVPASWGIEGWPENQPPVGLLFFNPRLQQGYKAWLKALLTTPNPYTGIPLASDPALAIIQIQNEDSMLFWTMQNVRGKQLELLGEQFGRWLAAKYGSLDGAFKAWGGDSMKEDDPSRGVVGIHLIWELLQDRRGGHKRRLDDQLKFFAETMFRFNQEIGRYLREELGCRQLVNAGNWKTADTIKLNDAERWSYTANEVVAVNNYYNPVHIGRERGWRINKGDKFLDHSILFEPRALPINLKQVAGHPMMITESNWVPPLSFLSESPLLVSAYQSLTGVDVFYWFVTLDVTWSGQDPNTGDAAGQDKWTFATPMVLGQFPAAALAFRAGYIEEAKPVVVEHRPLDQVWERQPPLIAEDPTYDPNRDLGDAARRSNLREGIDPLAFLVGPVKVVYGSDAAGNRVADLASEIDREHSVVRSATGQLALDSRTGLFTVNAPRIQGAAGFLARKSPVKLTDVTITSSNEYAAVVVVSLDGLSLARSRRVLVQVGTRARPTGWIDREVNFKSDSGKETYAGKEIVSTGKMPWTIVRADVTLTIANPGLKHAASLDENAIPRSMLKTSREGDLFRLKFPPDALYAVLGVD